MRLIERIFQDILECIECDKVAAEDSFIARIYLRSIDILEALLSPLKNRAETNTSTILATPVHKHAPSILI
ncbi:MAG: hypothetical protein COB36_12720 [Alphaproteobacteria bacterium]|nr:MAG: hypothetical protein COB36_12720 [Alphaproteobacteria bacterium]